MSTRPSADLVARGDAQGEGPRRTKIDGADVADARKFLPVGLVELVEEVVAVEAHGETLCFVLPNDPRVGKPIALLEQVLDFRVRVGERIVHRKRMARTVASLSAERYSACAAQVERILGAEPHRPLR